MRMIAYAMLAKAGACTARVFARFFFELFGPVHNVLDSRPHAFLSQARLAQEGACTARIFTRVMGFQFANHMIQRSVVTKHPRTWKLVEMRERSDAGCDRLLVLKLRPGF